MEEAVPAIDEPRVTLRARADYLRALSRHPRRWLRARSARHGSPEAWLREDEVPARTTGQFGSGGFLFTTDEGLYLRREGNSVLRLLSGHCYGLTRFGRSWIVGRTDRTEYDPQRAAPDLRTRNTHLYSFALEGASISELRCVATGLPGEVHQIDVAGGRVWLPLVLAPILLSIDAAELLSARGPGGASRFVPERLEVPGVTHVNSLAHDRSTGAIWFVAHNDSSRSGRNSQLLVRVPGGTWRLVETRARCAHDLFVHGGRWLLLDSLGGRLLMEGKAVYGVRGFSRGLSIGEESILLGVTATQPERRARRDADSTCVELDGSGRWLGELELRAVGPINQIRRLTDRELCLGQRALVDAPLAILRGE